MQITTPGCCWSIDIHMSINLIRGTVKPINLLTINYLILKTEFMTNILLSDMIKKMPWKVHFYIYKDKEDAHAVTVNVSWLGKLNKCKFDLWTSLKYFHFVSTLINLNLFSLIYCTWKLGNVFNSLSAYCSVQESNCSPPLSVMLTGYIHTHNRPRSCVTDAWPYTEPTAMLQWNKNKSVCIRWTHSSWWYVIAK